MSRVGLFCLVLALAVAPRSAAHPPSSMTAASEKGIAEEVVDFRRRMADAVKARDAAALRAMYAEQFQHVDPSARTEDRDARISTALAGESLIETAPVDDFKVQAHAGGWVAIATAVSSIKPRIGKDNQTVRWTAVFVRTETSWQLVASHATDSPEIKPK